MTGLATMELAGQLHIHVAFDWGEAVDLERARHLAPAELYALPRRRRTPPSIDYRPRPLRFSHPPVAFDLEELGTVQATAEVTVFDFAGVSVLLQIPFRLSAERLGRLASSLADSEAVVAQARRAVEPLHQRLLPAIESPHWSAISEEYFVFQLEPSDALTPSALLQGSTADWLAGLVRLETNPLSQEEVEEATRLRISYSPTELFIPDWAAGVLLDSACEETLEIVEFANLQLLAYRHIDDRLDENLAAAYRLVHPLRRAWLPPFSTHARALRKLGELQMEASELYERAINVLKLVGDQYLARVHRLLAARFHLKAWEKSIQRKLEVLEVTYRSLAEQASAYRAESLEWIIIVLIVVEVALALFHH